jgi:hypothetical protein
MTQHWLIRIGDGIHFINSSKFKIWGLDSKKKSQIVKFMRDIKQGDILWFITSKSQGKAISIAEFKEFKAREIGPLINISKTNKELGWTETDGDWDTEIHYTNLMNISKLEILTKIKSPLTYRLFNEQNNKLEVNLIQEYENIKRYSQVSYEME